MSEIKSFSVGNGDMFYISHDSDNFTIIDCCLNADNEESILKEIGPLARAKGITRFISTHPDDDHIGGLELLDHAIGILNFYCVRNNATKSEETDSFRKYCELRDSEKAFYIFRGCSRKWMNLGDEQREAAGITILWPDMTNKHFIQALENANAGDSPNNMSAVIQYSFGENITVLWMGDMETDFMESIENDLELPKVTILFAPHHGRESGTVPKTILEKMDPKIIVIGEAPSGFLNYYEGYNTITQNSAGDILFKCENGQIHVFTSQEYEADFLTDESRSLFGYHYIGSMTL